ncbi:MAG: hypothetical protein OXJ54_14590 [Gemmatimonadetes bacterium]|nr:hypothetical protein [Candidatus Palauibacter rhopaloidicola]
MIRHIWTVYCKEQLVDTATNNTSLIGILEQLNIGVDDESELTQLKIISFDSRLVTLWARRAWDTPVKSEMRIRFLGPEGSDLAEPVTYDVDLRQHLRVRVFTAVQTIGVTSSGVYEWVTERRGDADEEEWVAESRIPIEVRVTVGADDETPS